MTGTDRSAGGSGDRVLASGALAALVAKAGGTAAAFGLQLALARWLGSAGFGAWMVAFTWMGVGVLFAKQGLDTALLRFVPVFRQEGAEPSLERCVRTSRRRVLCVGVALALAGLLVVAVLGDRIGADLSGALYVLFLVVPVLALTQLEAGLLQATGRIALSQFPLLVALPVLVLAGVLVARWSGATTPRPSVAGGIYLLAAAGIWSFLRARTGTLLPGAGSPDEATGARPWFGVGRALLLSTGFGLVLSQADVLMIGALDGSAAAGPYAAATRVARLLALPLLAANTVLMPRFAALHAAGRASELQALVHRVARVLVSLALPLAATLAILRDPILALFGRGFPAAGPALLVLLVGQAVNVSMGSVGALLTMTGSHGSAARILGGGALLNLVLNAALIPRFGALGAAWATAVTTVLWNVTMAFAVYARLRIRPLPL